MNEVIVYLSEKDAEMFKRFRQYQNIFEKLFKDEFIGSLVCHKGKNNPKIQFIWTIPEEVIHT